MFSKKERSSFKYWFAHWCAYQMTALNLKCWKFKYLFHDIEKPWLKLIWHDYQRVRTWHRHHNRHHLTYKDPLKIDWEAAVIDWECSRFTKKEAQLNAYDTYLKMVQRKDLSKEIINGLNNKALPILEKLGLVPNK